MKKLLTIVVCDRIEEDDRIISYPEEIDVIYTNNHEADLPEALKQAKGKYTFIMPLGYSATDLNKLVPVLEESDEDIITLHQGSLIKTQLLKGLNFKENNCSFLLKLAAALNAKSIKRTLYTPFVYEAKPDVFNADMEDILMISCEQFRRVKAKLNKEVYNYVFETLVKEIVEFYMLALLAIRAKKYDAEKLVNFDNRLKGEIVLYIAVEKRFNPDIMKSLRDKKFKTGFFLSRKINKALITRSLKL